MAGPPSSAAAAARRRRGGELFACGVLDRGRRHAAEAFRIDSADITNDPRTLAVYRASRYCRVDAWRRGRGTRICSVRELIGPQRLEKLSSHQPPHRKCKLNLGAAGLNVTRASDRPPPFRAG